MGLKQKYTMESFEITEQASNILSQIDDATELILKISSISESKWCKISANNSFYHVDYYYDINGLVVDSIIEISSDDYLDAINDCKYLCL